MGPVPLVDLARRHDHVGDEVRDGWARVLENGGSLWAMTSGHSSTSGRHLHRRHCLGVGNGTDALELVLRAVGIGRGGAMRLIRSIHCRGAGKASVGTVAMKLSPSISRVLALRLSGQRESEIE